MRLLRMTPDDVPSLRELIDSVETFTTLHEVVEHDLRNRHDNIWVGAKDPEGKIVAAHRGVRAGNRLFLKGLIVSPEAEGTLLAMRIAWAIKQVAEEEGYAGLHSWIEPFKPEAILARRLRLQPEGELLHRFVIPIETLGTEGLPTPAETPPTNNRAGQAMMTGEDLLSVLTPVFSADDLVRWVHRSLPSTTRGQLANVEFSAPASDLPLVLSLLAMGARRINRTPVYLGTLDFAPEQVG